MSVRHGSYEHHPNLALSMSDPDCPNCKDERIATLEAKLAQAREALKASAQSLHYVSKLYPEDEKDPLEWANLRGYAHNRAEVAWDALRALDMVEGQG